MTVNEAQVNCRCVAEFKDPTAHLSLLELRLARRLGVEPEDVYGPPIAAIIGEAPGPNTSPKLPVFPLPRSSAGGRLLSYSRMAAGRYLGVFWRRNVYTHLQPWSVPEARERASFIVDDLNKNGIRRVVLLGGKVGAAFGLPEIWSHGFASQLELAVIPHPSGRCRIYNDDSAQRRAGAILRWAARLRRSLP